jgi:MFS family permease
MQRRGERSRRLPGLRPIVGMEVVSGIGDGVFWIGFADILIGRGVGAQGFALAVAARLGPRAIISAPAGVLADRVDRRRLLIGLDLGRAVLMVILAAGAAAHASLAALFVVVIASYTLAAPYRPALTAALPLVAGEDRLSSTNALVATVRQVMTFVGPVIGAVVLRWSSPTVAFVINAASFVVAACLIATATGLAGRPVRRRIDFARHRASWLRDLGDGWREVTATAGLGVVTILVFVMYAARGAELVLLVVFADQRLSLGAAGIGLLTGAIGLGALCVLPFAASVAETSRPTLVITFSVLTTALPLALLAGVHSPVVACAELIVLGAGVASFEVLSVVLLQRLVLRDVLGRVFGLVGTTSNAGKLIGALAVGTLASAEGLGRALVLSGFTVGAIGVAAIPRLVILARTTGYRRQELRPIVSALAALGLFEGAAPTALERVAASVVAVSLHAGTTVLREGDAPDDLFIVREGEFSVTRSGRVINTLYPDDWFGEIGLLQRRPRNATVVAATDAVAWRIPGETFLGALQESASEPTALIEVMADRLAREAAETRT